jgi:ATP-independent RNA helicase DbpA
VTEFCTFVAIERRLAQAAMDKLNSGTIKGKSVKVRLVR